MSDAAAPEFPTDFPRPDLSDEAVVRAVCGYRPCRQGGLRLETERDSGLTLVHNYGHGGCGVTIGPGTAQAAADLVDATLGARGVEAHAAGVGVPIGVLGGGVVGLLTARELAARGHRVRLIAERLAGETTSVLAGALWLPTGIDFGTGERLERFLGILHASRRWFAACDRARLGVEAVPVLEPEWAPEEPHFFDNGTIEPRRAIDRLPLEGEARGWPEPPPGFVFETDFIHTPRFLTALADDLRRAGVEIDRRGVRSRDDLRALGSSLAAGGGSGGGPAVLVNCSALGAARLFGDDAVYAARGVLVHARPQQLGYILHDGYRYMFCREDALVLGGSFDPVPAERLTDALANPTPEPPPEIVRRIIDHHRAFHAGDRVAPQVYPRLSASPVARRDRRAHST